jgi:hypothetical protein
VNVIIVEREVMQAKAASTTMISDISSLSLSLSVRNLAHQAGEALTGKVIVDVKKRIRGDRVMLTIFGKEKVIIRTGGKSKRTFRSERLIFTVSLPLREYSRSEIIQPGNYAFPFSVQLPASLPSSTAYPGNSKLGLRIQYKMIGSIGQLETKRYLYIQSAPLPREKVPAIVRPTSFTVNSMGLFKKGTCTIGASVEDSQVGRGNILRIHLACSNDSTETIRRVELKLVEAKQWKTFPVVRQRSAALVLKEMKNIDLPGLDKDKKNRREVRRSNSDRSLQETTYSTIFEALASRDNLVQLKVPTQARDSYSGQLIKIWHYLEIRIMTGPMANNPVVTVPIRVGSPPQARPIVQDAMPMHVSSSGQYTSTIPEAEYALPQIPYAQESAFAPHSQSTIPIVSAVAVPAVSGETFESPMVYAPQEVIVLGGDAIIVDEQSDLSDLIPIAPPRVSPPSLENLILEMVFSVNDFDIISARRRDPAWVPVFQAMSPQDLGTIIAHVNVDFDQPKVATLLAQHINGGRYFTCHYAAEAVKNTAEWNRATMAKQLIPMCVDISTHHALIRSELNEWELTVTARDFQDAIGRANGRI